MEGKSVIPETALKSASMVSGSEALVNVAVDGV
jgi:hypothetical protein